MIEVHLHLVVGDFENTTIESVAILVLQGYYGIHEDILMVEMSVDTEHLALEVEYSRSLAISISLVLVKLKLKVGSCLKVGNLLLKLLKSYTEAAQKLERTLCCCFLYEFSLSILYRIELVAHGNVLVAHNIYIMYFVL